MDREPTKLDYSTLHDPLLPPAKPWPRWSIFLLLALILALLLTAIAGVVHFVYAAWRA